MNYACYMGQGSHFSQRTQFSQIQIISTRYLITQDVMSYIVDNSSCSFYTTLHVIVL